VLLIVEDGPRGKVRRGSGLNVAAVSGGCEGVPDAVDLDDRRVWEIVIDGGTGALSGVVVVLPSTNGVALTEIQEGEKQAGVPE
jgi:hypothetical protein